jgi:hypothetical protein
MQPASEADALRRVVYLCVTNVVFPEAIALGVTIIRWILLYWKYFCKSFFFYFPFLTFRILTAYLSTFLLFFDFIFSLLLLFFFSMLTAVNCEYHHKKEFKQLQSSVSVSSLKNLSKIPETFGLSWAILVIDSLSRGYWVCLSFKEPSLNEQSRRQCHEKRLWIRSFTFQK